jgi:hypothetical protein
MQMTQPTIFALALLLLTTVAASAQSWGRGGAYTGADPRAAYYPRGGSQGTHRYCDELCRAKCDATWRFSRFRNQGVQACYAHWNVLNATPEKAHECENAHHRGQRISGG